MAASLCDRRIKVRIIGLNVFYYIARKQNERLMAMYSIRYVKGHVQVYFEGKFLFSADSEREAREELKEYAQSAA